MNLTRQTKRAATFSATLLTAALAMLVTATGASAHVTVHGDGAVRGGYAVLTFRVPTESDTASTTQVQVQLPLDHPIASVSVQPHPGWSFAVKTAKLAKPITTDDGPVSEAISEVDWKADSAATAIKPGEFDQFNISAGPLPDVASLTFPAVQTYSDGTVVKWIETQAPGSTTEPEHPAPTLQLAAAASSGTSSASSAASSGSGKGSGSASTGAATTAIVLGSLGVVLGLAALVVSVRRRASSG